MAAPKVVINFATGGLAEVESAIKVITSSLADLERKAVAGANAEADARKKAAKEKADAEKKAAKEAADVQKFAAKAQEATSKQQFKQWEQAQKERRKVADRNAKDFDRIKQRHEREALAKEKAGGSQSAFDKGSNLAAGGVIAGVLAGAALLKGALDLVTGALSQFGSYVLNDVIKPQLALGTKSMQIGNNLGTSRGAVRGKINALDAKYGGIDSNTVAEVFGIAAENTKDLGQSEEVANIALKASQSTHGLDPKQVAEMLGQKRRAMPSLSGAEFEEFSTLYLRRFTDDKRFNLKGAQVGAIGGLLEGLTDQMGGNDQTKAATQLGLTSLIGAASLKMKEGAGEGLAGVFKDIMDPQKGAGLGGTYIGNDGAKYVRPIDTTIGAMVTKYSGNLQQMQAAGMSEPTVKFLQALGVDRTYASAEATKKGSGQQAVIDQVRGLMAANPYGEQAKTFDKEFQDSQKDAAIQLEETFKRLKTTIAEAVMPVVEQDLIPAFKSIEPELKNLASSFGELIKDLQGVDLVGVFKAIAEGVGQAFYHLLDLANKLIPGFKMNEESLEKLRVATGANKTKTTVANAAEGTADGYFGRLTDAKSYTTAGGLAKTAAQYLTMPAMIVPMLAAKAAGAIGGGTDVGAAGPGENTEATRDTAALAAVKERLNNERAIKAAEDSSRAMRELVDTVAQGGWGPATSGAPMLARQPKK